MTGKNLIFLGVDGMDPMLVTHLFNKGKLPHLRKMAQNGCFSQSLSTNPPQSPVAWSTIATGTLPCHHGIYDFLHRDPKTYLPFLSILRQEGDRYVFPFKGETFWEKAANVGVRSVILRWPLTFPPRPTDGATLAGLGVPDIKGTLGIYSFFTSDASSLPPDCKGKIERVTVSGRKVKTVVTGPRFLSLTGKKEAILSFDMEIRESSIRCQVGDAVFDVPENGWSDWVTLRFTLGLMTHVECRCKFHLSSLRPELNLYMTPLNIDYESSIMRLSSPPGYAAALAKSIGDYSTLGFTEDTNGLNDGVLGEGAFLEIANNVMEERQRMLWHEMDNYRGGILACVFDTTDRIQHMFWRFLDETHPMFDERMMAQYRNVIFDYYEKIDEVVGHVMQRFASKASVLVCSDHGFASFKRAVNVNTWLSSNGYMGFLPGISRTESLLKGVDWSRTSAYSVGLNGIYINTRGREKGGLINPEMKGAFVRELCDKLHALKDGDTQVVAKAHMADELCRGGGAVSDEMPDIIIGFEKQYRSSWLTALGGGGAGTVFEDNMRKWSGDHCCDATQIPGVFFSSDGGFSGVSSVFDIAPAINEFFGV